VLKRGEPGGIVVTGPVMTALAVEAPDLRARCRQLPDGAWALV
jgi:hypothetical protein